MLSSLVNVDVFFLNYGGVLLQYNIQYIGLNISLYISDVSFQRPLHFSKIHNESQTDIFAQIATTHFILPIASLHLCI